MRPTLTLKDVRPRRVARRVALSLGAIICIHGGCGSATSPSPLPPAGYTGEWTGTTTQGTLVRFSVADGDEVTAFILAYNFSADCAGTLTNTNLTVPIHTLDPPGPPPFDQPGFGFSTNEKIGATLIAGHFSPDRRSASGKFTLVRYAGCDDVVVSDWNAQRR